jgi:hypothetical protein
MRDGLFRPDEPAGTLPRLTERGPTFALDLGHWAIGGSSSMSANMTGRSRQATASLSVGDFLTKTATGLMMVTAAFLVLFKLGAASATTADTAVQIFLN